MDYKNYMSIFGKLILENGSIYRGKLFGKKMNISGEIVFNTSMIGYPESMTDPSYKSQILVLTYPCIGNYGVPEPIRDEKTKLLKYFESENVQISGLIISDYSKKYSHWNSNKTLGKWMEEQNIPGLYDIDTRKLAKELREKGTMKGKIIYNEKSSIYFFDTKNLVKKVSNPSIREFNKKEGKYKIIAIDCGIKNNIIRKLLHYKDIYLKIVPYDYKITEKYDGLFISNGPGDPKDCLETIETIKLALEIGKPIFGICLGSQLLGLGCGCNTIKLKYGNRSVNQPVVDLRTNRAYVTSQNHGYAIDMKSIPKNWQPYFINANDLSNEGIIHEHKPYFGVQFHPEACNGPEDTDYLFQQFINSVKGLSYKNIESNFGFYYKLCQRNINKVLILGSGGLSIGQAGEFDYSGSQAIKALKENNIEIVLVNSNIATVQTSKYMANKIYYLAVNDENVEEIIKKEKPDAIMISFGGQTALNCGLSLNKKGIFEKYNVKVLGTSIESINISEDRDKFAELMENIGEPVAKRFIVNNINQIDKAINFIGFPMIMRNGFALGGLGSCFIYSKLELEEKLYELLKFGDYVMVEQSIRGWKEVEYEIVRDYSGNCVAVCNMENFDPIGIHTGDSIVVAPSQTLSNSDYYRLRASAMKIANKLKIIGECNVQFALDPKSDRYIIIELNPRLSRSSALASKATGYPLAYIAANILLGKSLIELKNNVTKITTACYEPSMDYIIVKIPKWDANKFDGINKILDTSMKSVGEVMAIGRNFEETIQKAIRMIDQKYIGFEYKDNISKDQVIYQLKNPSFNRILVISRAFDLNLSIDEIHNLTKIDKWFLYKLHNIHEKKIYLKDKIYHQINNNSHSDTFYFKKLSIFKKDIIESKKIGFSDRFLAEIFNCNERDIYDYRHMNNILPSVKQIDTTAGEFPAETNYLYLTYNGNESDVEFNNDGIIVLGCGSYRIGSSVEFDWCAVNCVNTIKKNDKYSIIINYNPETVSTDYDASDRLYFEEISLETVSDIYRLENANGIIISVGGQTPNNIALGLAKNGVNILGTSSKNIDRAEDRHKFSKLLDKIDVDQPEWTEVDKIDDAIDFCNKINYPVLIRPSYVLSGAAMKVAENDSQLIDYLKQAGKVSKDYPVVISRFISDAKEIEIDAVADNGKLINYAISEHVENAGTHSGDATLIFPAQKIYLETIKRIKKVTKKIVKNLDITGPFNIQFISKENEIKVIECNLRASRSFPFVSKTLDANFIELATNIMLQTKYIPSKINTDNIDHVAIKVPVFSFSRLPNVDPILGVEMLSTGEVASFGYNVKETYIKALMASGFKLPKKGILISIGSDKCKYEFLNSLKTLKKLNYSIYTTEGTYLFYKQKNIDTIKLDIFNILKKIENKEIECVINIPRNTFHRGKDTNGYIIRRKCVDYDSSLLTNIKCSRLFVSSLKIFKEKKINCKSWQEYLISFN